MNKETNKKTTEAKKENFEINKKITQISFNKLYVSDNLNKETNLNKICGDFCRFLFPNEILVELLHKIYRMIPAEHSSLWCLRGIVNGLFK